MEASARWARGTSWAEAPRGSVHPSVWSLPSSVPCRPAPCQTWETGQLSLMASSSFCKPQCHWEERGQTRLVPRGSGLWELQAEPLPQHPTSRERHTLSWAALAPPGHAGQVLSETPEPGELREDTAGELGSSGPTPQASLALSLRTEGLWVWRGELATAESWGLAVDGWDRLVAVLGVPAAPAAGAEAEDVSALETCEL